MNDSFDNKSDNRFPFPDENTNPTMRAEILEIVDNSISQTLGEIIQISIKITDVLLKYHDNIWQRSFLLLLKILSITTYESFSKEEKDLVVEKPLLDKIFSYSRDFLGDFNKDYYFADIKLVRNFKDNLITYFTKNEYSDLKIKEFLKRFDSNLIEVLSSNDEYLIAFCKIHRVHAYISIPFTDEFSQNKVYELVGEVIMNYGLSPTTTSGSINSPKEPIPFTNTLKQTDIIIADLSGLDPSVMFEIGYGMALNKRIIFLVNDKIKNIPSFLQGHIFYIYGNFPDENLKKSLEKTIKNFLIEEILW